MTNQQHPITPPPELVQQWRNSSRTSDMHFCLEHIATQAARWGADQELEACCDYMQQEDFHGFAKELRAARRPRLSSLKEQALEALNQADKGLNESEWQQRSDIIRRALEQLDD